MRGRDRGKLAKLVRGLSGLLLLLPARHLAAEGLDLEGAVALALAGNPALQAERERARELGGAVREAAAESWPRLGLTGSASSSRSAGLLNSPDFDELLRQLPEVRPSSRDLWTLEIEVHQFLYSGGGLRAAVEIAELARAATLARVEVARLDTALAAAEAFYRLLAAEEALATLKSQQRARRESRAVVEARFELGDATRLELLRADAALRSVAPEVAEARGRVEVEKGRLRVVLGLAPEAPVAAAAASAELSEPRSLGELLALAGRERQELVDLGRQIEALERRLDLVRAGGRPRLELVGRWGRQARHVDDLADPLFADWSLSLDLHWDFFDGGRRRGERVQIESQRRQLLFRLRDAENRIAFEVSRSLAEYTTARERWLAAEASAVAAREAARVAAESYRLGVALQADLLDAQEQEIRAEFLRVESFYEAHARSSALLRALGRLPTEPLERVRGAGAGAAREAIPGTITEESGER